MYLTQITFAIFTLLLSCVTAAPAMSSCHRAQQAVMSCCKAQGYVHDCCVKILKERSIANETCSCIITPLDTAETGFSIRLTENLISLSVERSQPPLAATLSLIGFLSRPPPDYQHPVSQKIYIVNRTLLI